MDENEFFHKNNQRNQYNLTIRSNEYEVILDYIKYSIVIKQEQLTCLREMSKIVNLPNKLSEKEELFERCSSSNVKTTVNTLHLVKINNEYIQGLFDAEGCVYIDRNNFSYYLKISQKSHPEVLYEIQKYLGYGTVRENYFTITNKADCLRFIEIIKHGLIVKYNQVAAFEKMLLQSQVKGVKEEMYKICNEEKHKIENFNELNQNDTGKEAFLKTVGMREIKQTVCSQLHLKQVYKEKSENMKGDNNHNYGKTFSEETRKKMSTSIRDAKNGISDEMIEQVRTMLQNGSKNVDIQEALQLPRHIVTRIKNGIMVTRTETKQERVSMTPQEMALSKRKIRLEEILMVVEQTVHEDKKPTDILNFLVHRRKELTIQNELTVDMIKNTRRSIQQNRIPFYEDEMEPDKYDHYVEMIRQYNIKKNIQTNVEETAKESV
jgi:hypothetical protein